MFNFFLSSHRHGLLQFTGVKIKVEHDVNGPEGKNTFRKYENGQYKDGKGTLPILTRHPNIVHSVISGKKSWGLHVRMWSQGIGEWCFTKEELLEQFTEKGIIVPEPLLKDFDFWIQKEKDKRYLDYPI